MNRLIESFAERARARRGSLVPYVTAGYPDVATTVEILRGIEAASCACVELGIPFSDPIADGPVIQTSFSRALAGGFRIDALLDALREARGTIAVPLAAMVSYSIVYRRGPAEFVAALRAAGIDGLIVPDLAIEEADELSHVCRAAGASLVMIAAPTTTPSRRTKIAQLSSPFLYYQCVAGITGERAGLPPDLAPAVAALRAASGRPVCVGFGISTPEQVRAVCAVADGAIVGSALVRRMNDAVDAGLRGAALATPLLEAIRTLAAGLAPAAPPSGGAR